MGHNSVVSGHSKSTGIPSVDGLLTGRPDLGRHIDTSTWRRILVHFLIGTTPKGTRVRKAHLIGMIVLHV